MANISDDTRAGIEATLRLLEADFPANVAAVKGIRDDVGGNNESRLEAARMLTKWRIQFGELVSRRATGGSDA